jgi:uncharacterized membrane protein YfcA
MLEIIVGAVLGFLAGLGVGGGSLLILWLTLVLKIPADTAAGINLLFFVPTAITASLFRLKQGTLDFKRILPALMAAVASTAALTLLSGNLDAELLRKPFGILLLVTGIREICYRPRKAR